VLLLSLTLHAAAFTLWPDAAAIISEPLPAGPIALQLQNTAAGGSHRSAPAEADTETSPQTAHAAREKYTVPGGAESAPHPVRHTTERTSFAKPVVAHSSTPAATDEASPVPDASTHAAATTGAESGAALREQLRSRLQSALIAHFDYPLLARRRGWEGVVRVGVRVEADGQLTRLRVIGSSGHALLDRAALNSLSQVDRLADVISWLQGRRFDMVLPVRYQLIDS
jgi:protein TonB